MGALRQPGSARARIVVRALAVLALGVGCSTNVPFFLGTTLELRLAPGEAVHVTLAANAVAIAESDMGAVAEIRGRPTVVVRWVPDDPGGELLTGGPSPLFDRDPSLGARCGGVDPCLGGGTIELVDAPGPETLTVRMGLERNGDDGCVLTELVDFSSAASVAVFVD